MEDFRVDGVERLAEVHKQYPWVHPRGVEVMQDVAQSDIDYIIH